MTNMGERVEAAAGDNPGVVSTDGRSSTVLCVEDDESTAELVAHIFDLHPDITLVVAHDGVHGLELAVEERPDLVLLDLNIDGIGGEEILRTLRARPETAAVPVVIVTADAGEETSWRLLTGGADAVVNKPFLPEQLLEIVEAALTSGSSSISAPKGTVSPCDVLDPPTIAALAELDARLDAGNGIDHLVRSAMAGARDRLQSLHAAASRQDTKEMSRHAHALRGVLANFGANVVAEHCGDIEALVHAGDMDPIGDALSRLTTALAEAEEALFRHFPPGSTDRLADQSTGGEYR